MTKSIAMKWFVTNQMKGIQKPLCAGWYITQEILTYDYRMVSILALFSREIQMLIIFAAATAIVILQVVHDE